ncbi:translocation/assembly module TamB domain-containing protein [uncultured Thiohalocapsa sp.]|uniref:translocation/assembly module TamB domain-containing protein n=1 Tax=uncultured Thiohalocapsa sp. TaxID=768990 RepID=UPI0025E11EC1|nr:translocation/assembly module TamB domain-containing protein [uncultured Thiohalocapsa sp.]
MAKRTASRSLISFPLLGLLLRLIGLLMLVLLLGLGFVLGTQTGLRLAVAVAEELAPEQVQVGGVDGRVLGELTVTQLSLDLPGLALGLGRLHLDWQPTALLRGQLRVVDLSASDIDVVTKPPAQDKPPAEPFTLPQIRLPVAVDVGRVLIEDVRIRSQDASPAAAIHVTRAELSASADGDRVALRRLRTDLAQPEASASATGEIRLTGDYPVSLALDWRFRRPPALTLTGAGSLEGDLAALRIAHQVQGAADLTLTATVRDVLKAPSWTGELALSRLDLPAVVGDAPAVDLSARLETRGDLERATLTGTLQGQAPDIGALGQLDAALDLIWAEQRLTLNAVKLQERASGAMLDLGGHADLAGDVPAFSVSGRWQQLRWPLIGDARVTAPAGTLSVSGDLDAFDYRLDGEVQGADIPPATLALAGRAGARDTRIDALSIDTLGGRIEAKGTVAWAPAVTWDLAVTAADLDPGRQLPGLDGTLSMKANAQGGLEDGYSFGANLSAGLIAYPEAVVNLAGGGDRKQVHLRTLTVETLGGRIDGGGEVAWAPTLTWKLALRAEDLDPGRRYPDLAGRLGFALNSAGGLEAGFEYSLQGSAELARYPPAVVDLRGTGTGQATALQTLDIQVLDGRISGEGRLTWSPAVQWEAALRLAALNPGSVLADWPGRIDGVLESSGRLTAQGPDLSARISDVAGTLRGYPVRLAAELGMAGHDVTLRSLSAGSGTTRLTAAGGVSDDNVSLRFDLASPDLAALLPGAAGSLDIAGEVAGTTAAPRVRVNLQGRDAELNAQGIAEVTARADVGLGPDDDFEVDIQGKNLIIGGQRFETLAVTGGGRMAQHQLRAAVSGDLLALELAAGGGLGADGAYAARLATLALATEEFGTWTLQRPADVSLAGGAIALGPLCLGDGEGSAGCAELEQRQPGTFTAALDVERLELDVFNALLPPLMVATGHVRANARFTGEGNRLTGSARVEVPTGELSMALGEGEAQADERLVFSSTRLDLNAGAGGLEARLDLPVTDLGGLRADVSLPGFRLDTGAAQALRGDAQISLDGLARVSNLLPDITNVSGDIDGDLRLAGTLGQPDLRGELRVRGLGLQMPLYGFGLSNTDLTLASRSADDWVLSGGADIGGGRVTLAGEVDLGADPPAAQISVSGQNLRVADSSEYFALVSLDMSVGVGAAGTAVQGTIKVPEARIKPRTIPTGAVQPSPDVVMEAPAAGDGAAPLSINVLTRLGDEVSIDAFGLRGRLQGELRVLKSPQGELLGDGQLEIVDGSYRVTLPALGVMTAIGKPLTIEQGFLVFAKTPIGNPGLILNAQRVGGDISAGVQVLGTIRNPKLAFFSESDPNLTQAEVTQYLVTGIPPKRDAAADKRAVAVGTYVAPKLYMEYEGATSDTKDSVKMRYDLSKNIELQTETGDSQGADIFFKFEN